MPKLKPSYASPAAVSRVLKGVEKAGISIGSVRLFTDGTIEIESAGMPRSAPANGFDEFEELL